MVNKMKNICPTCGKTSRKHLPLEIYPTSIIGTNYKILDIEGCGVLSIIKENEKQISKYVSQKEFDYAKALFEQDGRWIATFEQRIESARKNGRLSSDEYMNLYGLIDKMRDILAFSDVYKIRKIKEKQLIEDF